MIAEEKAGQLIQQIYAASLTPEHWLDFLQSLAVAIGGTLPALVVRTVTHESLELVIVQDLADEDLARHRYYLQRLHRSHPALSRLRVGSVVLTQAIFSEGVFFRSEYYEEWAQPLGLGPGMMGRIDAEPQCPHIVVYRRTDEPAFGERELRLLERLMPHLGQALFIQRRLQTTKDRCAAATEVLDALPTGVILLDEKGTVLEANQAGDRILSENDGLGISDHLLHAATPAETQMLRRLVHEAAITGAGFGNSSVVRLTRSSGRRDLEAVVKGCGTPVARETAANLVGICPAALLFVTDRSTPLNVSSLALRRLYRLTPTEASITLLLAAGKSVDEIAQKLGVQSNTIRVHLRSVYSKTETRQQSELVHFILTGPATWLKFQGDQE